MADWTDNIPTFDAEAISLLPEAGPDIEAELVAEMDLLPHLDQDRRHEAEGIERECRDARQIKSAAEAIGHIPGPAQAIHLAISGRFAMWDIVPAVLELAAPAIIDALHIATLGFSRNNVAELVEHLDAGKVGTVKLLASHYFKGTSNGIYEYAVAELAGRSDRAAFLSVRSHAKILCLKLGDGRTIVVESSANLRSCKNIEQLSIFGDPKLYAFHAGWMDQLFAKAAAKPGDEASPEARPQRPRPGHSQKRAGLGVYAVAIDQDSRQELLAWKARPADPEQTARYATALADLIRQFSPRLPSDAIVTTPPQGASAPGRHHARALAEEVARQIGRPFRQTLIRNRPKRGHHPQESRRQEPYTATGQPPRFALVVDDLITSGTTMRLALEALRGAGAVALGFAYAGC